MSDPWFPDPNMFGAIYGSVVGGVGGSLLGLLGAAAGTLAPQGKGRSWILGSMTAAVGLGVVQLAAGIVALATGQPYGIWYPLLLTGVIFTVVVGALLPVVRRRYDEAEQRRMQAESIRAS